MQKTRIWLLIFAVLVFGASVASLYVHYNLLKDSSYTSFCDISETVSCEAVYLSEYGTVRGVPVASGGAIWSALVFLLVYRGMRYQKSETGAHVAEYVFVLSVVGLAAVLYLGYASVFVLDTICILCAATYVGVFGIFFISAGMTTMPLRTLPGRLLGDMRALLANPAALTLALLWLVGAGSLVAFFPRERTTSVAAASAEAEVSESVADQAAALSTGGLTASQLADFERWFLAQPYIPLAIPSEGARVLIVKFNDYQCPPCRQTFLQYKGILAKFQQSHPGQVKFVTKDFPLEPECNVGGGHDAACEAAAAVRMARANNRAEALEDWLFANQPAMTPELVRQGARQVGQVSNFDAQYPGVLQQVRADVALAHKSGVNRTPTFFINGRKVEGGLEPPFFEAAIAYELKRSQGSPP